MENQIPPSNVPSTTEPDTGAMPFLQNITPQQLEELKARAREAAIRMTMEQTQAQAQPQPQNAPQVVYVRRNLTVAELLVVFILSCGLVLGLQGGWHLATNVLPRLEVKLK